MLVGKVTDSNCTQKGNAHRVTERSVKVVMSVSLVIVVQNIQDGKLEFDRIVSGIVEKRSIYYLLLISNIKQNS